jgi:hypothetical protein
MGAYLVLAPSLQRDFQGSNAREAAQNAVVGDGAFPFTWIRGGVHPQGAVLGEVAFDRAGVVLHQAHHYRPVFAIDGVSLEEAPQGSPGRLGFCEHKQAADKLVEAMDDEDRPLTAAGLSTAAEKGVCRIFGFVGSGHREEPVRLVDDDNIPVLVNDFEPSCEQGWQAAADFQNITGTDGLLREAADLAIEAYTALLKHLPQGPA